MVRYRRNFIAGGTFFITATLADRRSRVLVDHVEALRTAMRVTRQRHPFTINAAVVLPDHLHMVMTLPDGDADFSMRWSLIKRRFTSAVTTTGMQVARHSNGEAALGSADSGNTRSATKAISSDMSTTFIAIP
jgi:putative transposase